MRSTQGTYYKFSNLSIRIDLGNVRAIITDRKFIKDKSIFIAELVTATDYYAFGAPLYGRKYVSQSGSYRFGFNTQKKVDEISGEGNHNTAEFWEYDTRLGRRWNLDPKPQINFSDYACLRNNPILFTEKKGDFAIIDDAIVGFFKGLFANRKNFEKPGSSRIGNAFRRSGRDALNSAKIWGGLFVSDKEKSVGGRALEVASRFTWQLPQTLVGYIYNHGASMFGNVSGVEYFHGATAVKGAGLKGASATLGSYISLGSTNLDNQVNVGIGAGSYTFMHEYGHYLQSQISGWNYLLGYGLPSIRNAKLTEWDANQRSADYLEETQGFEWDPNFYDKLPVPIRVKKENKKKYLDSMKIYTYLPGYIINNPDIWHILNIPNPLQPIIDFKKKMIK